MKGTDTRHHLAHRPTDVVRAVVFLILLVLTSIEVVRGDLDLSSWSSLVEGIPDWFARVFVAVVLTGLAVALFLVVLSVVRLRSDATFARDVVVVLIVTITASSLLALVVADRGTQSGTLDPSRSVLIAFPDVVIAVIVSVIVVSSAHLARPNRRLLWWLLVASAAAGAVTSPSALLPVVGGLALGLAVGSGWLWLVGSPAGLPDTSLVQASLARHGVHVDNVTMLPARPWGGAVMCTATPHGADGPLGIKIYGRDAVTADFWVRWFRRITYLDAQRSWSGKGIDSVEHEAVATALADQFGVPVTRVVAVSDWAETDPFIAVRWTGQTLDETPDDAISGPMVAHLWANVVSLHAVGIIHGSLDGASLRVDGDTVVIANLERARFVSDKRLQDRDLANLLVLIGARIGADRAVRSAVEALGVESVNDLASYLEPAAIRVPLEGGRERLKELLASLRHDIAAATGMTPPPPAVLKRLTVRRLVAMGLVVFAVTALISQLGGIDFAAVAQEVVDATWILVLIALVVGQLILIPEALATSSLVPERLPFGPLVALQSAMRFLGLAVPGPAARVAANVAFLRKEGITVARSLTLGILDSATGLLVELIILVLAVAVGDLSLALFGIDPVDIDWGLVTVLLLGAVAVVALVLRFVKSIRERVTTAWESVQEALAVLRDSPSRAFALFAANLAARIISACALWLVLAALGVELDILAVLVVIAASNLLSGLIPVPGNVGVAEAALTAFMVAAGVEEDTAFAAAVVYRMITAYIPPFWGAAAQRWLVRNDYL